MAKSSAISARIDEEVKSAAEQVFQLLGLSSSQAITLFYRQVALHRGLPFAVQLPAGKPPLPARTEHVKSVRGKYADVPTSSEEFARRKLAEIEREG